VPDGPLSAGVKGLVLVALTLSIVSRMRGTEIDAPSDLRGKFFESFGPDRAGSPQFARRHWRGHGEMEPRVKSSRFICGSEIAIELLELVAQSSEVVRHCCGIVDVVVRAEETVEGCFDEPRFCGTGFFGRFRQPRSHVFGEVNADSGFHEKDLL
jgi:hypothetical protein